MMALLQELKTEYAEHGVQDAVERIEEELLDLSLRYGRDRGRIVLASAMEESEGFIGGICMTTINRLDGTEPCELRYLYVLPDYRTKRIGKRLIERAIQAARDVGCKSVYVEVKEVLLGTALDVFTEVKFERSSRPPMQPGRAVLERQLDG
jgi:GNAT superfamily N-acetyltransferase